MRKWERERGREKERGMYVFGEEKNPEVYSKEE